jgi:tetratricopeptide (TPR) repeat protein
VSQVEKYEYNTKTQQIKKMYSKKDFLTVSEIADNIDIRKVKDSSLINIIADAYEETKQFEKAKDVLLFAYERSPLGRQLAYRLTLICVNLGQLDEAVEFYDDFTKMAPKDMGQYLLQYEIAKAQGSSLDEQIEILEKYVSYELDEKWQYELAKLYHENGQSEQCIKQCDELILWFNEGKYVNQAMELKLL